MIIATTVWCLYSVAQSVDGKDASVLPSSPLHLWPTPLLRPSLPSPLTLLEAVHRLRGPRAPGEIIHPRGDLELWTLRSRGRVLRLEA